MAFKSKIKSTLARGSAITAGLVTAALAGTVLAGMAVAGADTTFLAAETQLGDWLAGSGGRIITLIALGYAAAGAIARMSIGTILVPAGIGLLVGIGGRGGSINANEVAAFETFLVDHLSQTNGRPVSAREAQKYWVGLTGSDMGRAEQREMQTGFFETRLRAQSFSNPVGFVDPAGGGYSTVSDFSVPGAQRASFDLSAESRSTEFESRTGPMAPPISSGVDERYSETLRQRAEIRDYVAGSGDDIARQTAITNGEAHIHKYGMESYLEWAGGEDNARVVFGDTRFEQLAAEDAERQEAGTRIRSAK